MTRRRRIALAVGLLVLAVFGGCASLFVRTGPDPCAEPSEPAARPDVVRCAEGYVREQWYTGRLGKLGALESDPHGGGSWLELVREHRGTLREQIDALCTHPRDQKGALGHTAIFETTDPSKGPCRVFAITPLLGVSLRNQTCEQVRSSSTCIPRADALR